MSGLGTATGVVCLVAGILEALFGLLAMMGMIMGGVMASGALPPTNGDDPAMVGGILLGVYAVFFLCCLIGAIAHIGAGIQLMRGAPNRKFLWIAAVGSVAPLCTMYCALTTLPAGIMLLVYLLTEQEAAADPDLLV